MSVNIQTSKDSVSVLFKIIVSCKIKHRIIENSQFEFQRQTASYCILLPKFSSYLHTGFSN